MVVMVFSDLGFHEVIPSSVISQDVMDVRLLTTLYVVYIRYIFILMFLLLLTYMYIKVF